MLPKGLLAAADLGSAQLVGVAEGVYNGERILRPAHGARVVRGLLEVGFSRDDEAMVSVMRDAGMSAAAIAMFASTRMVVRRPPQDGSGVAVVPHIPGLTTEPLSEYAGSSVDDDDDGILVERSSVVDARALTYKLNAVFTDVSLVDKLQISPRRMQMYKRLAVTEPDNAAVQMTHYLRANGFPNCKVTAGDYACTIKRARDAIRSYARLDRYNDTGVRSLVTAADLIMTYVDFETEDERWWVKGPLKYATEVQAIYQLSLNHGPNTIMFVLGEETAMLDINSYDMESEAYYSGIVEGYSSLAGITPMMTGYPAELTADQKMRLNAASKKVMPVVVNEHVVGSAVRVTDSQVILNEHTVTSVANSGCEAHVDGVLVADTTSVATDVSVVRRLGVDTKWFLREPDVGERVVLCFSVGDKQVEYSEVLKVVGVRGENMILSTSNVLRKGASGAAVLALRDTALLGIFSTVRGTSVLCSILSSRVFSAITDCQSVVSSDVGVSQVVNPGDATYSRMVTRGLLEFMKGISEACVSLYTQYGSVMSYAGIAVNVAGFWYTTLDPDERQLKLGDGVALTFERSGDLFVVTNPPPILSVVPNMREPVPGERVFYFSKQGDDVIMSVLRNVTHCHAGSKEFHVDDFGESSNVCAGGLIVAERDAAVLGYLHDIAYDDFGDRSIFCKAFPIGVDSRVDNDNGRMAIELMDKAQKASDTEFLLFSRYGEMMVNMIAGMCSYEATASLSSRSLDNMSLWRVNQFEALATMGFSDDDFRKFNTFERDRVMDAFIAALMLADSSVKVATLIGKVLTGGVNAPDVVAIGNSIQRSVSANSFGTVRPSLEVSSYDRVAKLENDFKSLYDLVASGLDVRAIEHKSD